MQGGEPGEREPPDGIFGAPSSKMGLLTVEFSSVLGEATAALLSKLVEAAMEDCLTSKFPVGRLLRLLEATVVENGFVSKVCVATLSIESFSRHTRLVTFGFPP